MSTLGEAAAGAADLVAELRAATAAMANMVTLSCKAADQAERERDAARAEADALEQLLDAELAERRKVTEQAVRLTAENDRLRVDFAKDMAAIASYRNDIADLREQRDAAHLAMQGQQLRVAELERELAAARSSAGEAP